MKHSRTSLDSCPSQICLMFGWSKDDCGIRLPVQLFRDSLCMITCPVSGDSTAWRRNAMIVLFDATSTDHFDTATTELFENSVKLLHRFPDLHPMAFEFFTESAPDKGEMYYVEIQLALWTSLETTPLPRLRSLCIGSMVSCFPYGLEEDDPLLTIFHSLTSLSISGVSLFQARRLPPEILNFSVNLSHILLAARNITSLQLGLEDLARPTSPFQFESLRFPAASLTLHTIVFAGLADGEEPLISSIQGQGLTVEKFILNHKATLQRLELHDCVAAVPDGAWHRVFRRFRLQLSELVEFVWTTQATERNKNFHYARPVGTLETYT